MSELRIAVLGVGVMVADHVARITSRISGARVAGDPLDAIAADAGTSLEVVRREAEFGMPLIQVGFMRRFDPEYARLKAVIDGGRRASTRRWW